MPAALAALATAASSSRCVVRPSVTGSFGVMLAMFQWVRSRIAAMVVRVVPISLLIWPSVTSGWLRMIQAIPSGLSWRLRNRRVARALGAAHRVGRLVHLQPVVGVLLALLDFLVGQLAGADRVAAGQLGRRGVVGDRLHLEDVKAAEFGDLLEGQRTVLDQPGGGRMGHQGLGHWVFSG